MITHTPDNREIYYLTKGTGPELLFLHGGGGGHFKEIVEVLGGGGHFKEIVEVLSPQYSCTTFDRLGWGRSTHLDRNTTMEDQVTAIEAVHNCVTSAPIWVFAHSSGGNYALAYALSCPNRVKGIVMVEPALYGIYPPEMKDETTGSRTYGGINISGPTGTARGGMGWVH
jgi:pimeloyl-ACP methyl ester carboxylesterase